MKRLAALSLCLCLVAPAAAPAPAPKKAGPPRAAAVSVRTAVSTGPWSLDIRALVPSLRPMQEKERADQLRDWALYGLLMQLGLPPADLARATNQVAPLRLPYLEELFAFEYGRGRRAIVSDDRVLLLVEREDPDPQATLGRLADRVRMETGQVPATFEIYAFSADVPGGAIQVDLKTALAGPALFSPEYGYSEAVVGGQEQLGRWLGTVDDVTYVAQAPQGVKLGGRRFVKSRTLGASLEDVAALYQAHTWLVAERQRQIDRWKETVARGGEELRGAVEAMQREAAAKHPGDALAQNAEVYRLANERYRDVQLAAYRDMRPVPGAPGFSLDPRTRGPELAATLAQLADDPCRALETLRDRMKADTVRLGHTGTRPGMALSGGEIFERGAAKLGARCEALKREPYRSRFKAVAEAAKGLTSPGAEQEALAPLRAWSSELNESYEAAIRMSMDGPRDATRDAPQRFRDSPQGFLREVLDLAREAAGEQCARYDGPLGGTRVGVNLFYTDLLAKLWSLDVAHTAPGLRVAGFVSKSRLPPSGYWQEMFSASVTRQWFGPRKEAYTRSEDGAELRFQHVATRVFAAGSDPDHPEYMETAPQEHSRRAVGWWERHYSDVADYEQEYHLQNQVMKWSVITGFFQAKGLAPYLQGVHVDHSAQFGRWYEQHRSQLRYQLPLQIGGDAGQECMDLLSRAGSEISGGVALPSGTLEGIPALSSREAASVRLPKAVAAEVKPGQLGRAFPRVTDRGVIEVEPLPMTRTRSEGMQVELGKVQLTHRETARGEYQLALSTEHAAIGELTATRDTGRLLLGWSPGEAAEAPRMAKRISSGRQAVPVATEVYKGPAGGRAGHLWPSELNVPESYDRMVPTAKGDGYVRVRRSNAPDAHAAPKPLSSVLEPYRYQRYAVDPVAGGQSTSQGVIRTATNAGPGPGARTIRVDGLPGFPRGLEVQAEGGSVWARKPADAAGQAKWSALDSKAPLTQANLNEIVTAHANGESVVHVQGAHAELAARAEFAGDPAQAANLERSLAKEVGQEQAAKQVQRHLQAAGDFQLRRGNAGEASQLYDLAKAHGEEAPDALIKRTIADVAGGRAPPETLESVLDRHVSKLSYEQRIEISKAVHGLQETPDIEAVTDVKLGAEKLVPREARSKLTLGNDGPEVVAGYRQPRAIEGKVLHDQDFDAPLPPDATVYVSDQFSFNTNDFQASPAENLAELGSNPEVEVVRLDRMDTGQFRPGKVYEPAGGGVVRQYRRVSGPSIVDGDGPIFFVRPRGGVIPGAVRCDDKCDVNHDGVVSDDECRRCQAH